MNSTSRCSGNLGVMKYPVAFLASFLLAACGGGGEDSRGTDLGPVPVASHVRLQSDPADVMGQGGTYEYSRANAGIFVEANAVIVQLEIISAQHRWRGVFELPSGQALQPGNYVLQNGTRFGLAPADGSSGWVRACAGSTRGQLNVFSTRYSGPQLVAVSMEFELRCDNDPTGALRGRVDWRLDA